MWNPDIKRIAEAVQDAPSIFNSQPWSLEMPAADRIELRANLGKRDHVDRGHWDRWLSADGTLHPDPLAREFAISCGAALFNLRLAIRVAGHDLTVWLLPDPEHDSALLASVEIVTGRIKKPTIVEQELYEAIWRRHTNRWPYTIVPVPLPIIVEMEHAASEEGASLRLLHTHQGRTWMNAVRQADSDLASEPPDLSAITHQRYQLYREQRNRWTGQQGGGVGVSTANFGPTPTNRDPRTREDFWLGNQRQRFERKPQLMALSTSDDQPVDWLRAGQALQRAILTGTRYSVSAPYGLGAEYHSPRRYGVPARHHFLRHDDLARYGLSASPLTQPLERYDIEREDVHAAPRQWPWRWRFPEVPQMVIRVGYTAVPTPAEQREEPDIPQVPDPQGT